LPKFDLSSESEDDSEDQNKGSQKDILLL
jgi:hypothetical protein